MNLMLKHEHMDVTYGKHDQESRKNHLFEFEFFFIIIFITMFRITQ